MDQESLQQRIDETLQSLDGMSRAQAPADLYEQALLRVRAQQSYLRPVRPVRQWLAAASLATVLLLNLAAWRRYDAQDNNNPTAAVAAEYFNFFNAPSL